MKKIHIKLTESATRLLCDILTEIRNTSPQRAPGLEVEILLMHEFHDRYMPALHWPTTNDDGQPLNKFHMPESQALALTKTLIGFDMHGFDAYYQTLRNDIADMIARQIGHLFSTPFAEHLKRTNP